ncbi:MAG: hypothetical protein GX318_03420 [Clostridia bacterium]|nr:hypothetical protein [Clostridia bacterium]
MDKSILISFFLGLVFGTTVSTSSYFIAGKVVRRLLEKKARNKNVLEMAVFAVRYITNIIALVLVRKNIPVLLGTAIGLTMIKNYLVYKTLSKKKG